MGMRRKRRRSGGGGVTFNSRISYEKVRAALWMTRLLDDKIFVMDTNFFDYLHWISVDLRSLLEGIIASISQTSVDEDVLDALNDAEEWSNDKLLRDFNDLVDDYPCIVEDVRLGAIKLCEAVAEANAFDADERACARKQMKKVFGLDNLSLDLFEFVHFLETNSRILDCYFDNSLEIWKTNNRDILACALDADRSEVERVLSSLSSCGILDMEPGRSCRVEDEIVHLWEAPDTHNAGKLFCVPVKGETLTLEKFRISEEELNYVSKLLTLKSDIPVHIMLYGSPGTGKTTFARSLASHLGLKAWSVSSNDERRGMGRRAAITACLNLSRRHKGSFVLVDEAEKVLDTGFGRTQDKGWLNALLEKPGNRIIWITNYVHHIDPAVRRRFSFSVFFGALGQNERRSLWEEIITRQKVEKYFTKAQVETLAKDLVVPAAVINDAIKRAKAMRCGSAEFVSAVECSIRAYETFLRDGEEKQAHAEPKGFTQDGVTLEGSLDTLMERCRRADDAMRRAKDAKAELEGGCATMLFYGPPGTGKTALARHISKTLGRECIVKRASDLLNCYVGNTEKNIARAFREAEKKEAVLVIDEADTFIFSRDTAQKSWETSLVNEFLTNLEVCRCFCICTTNRLDDLDSAALRRFSCKVEFTWAKPKQVTALYNALLAPLCRDEMTPELKGELRAFTRLTPGDFHTVRGQFNSFLSDKKTATHEAMIAALRREVELKGRYASRKAGF